MRPVFQLETILSIVPVHSRHDTQPWRTVSFSFSSPQNTTTKNNVQEKRKKKGKKFRKYWIRVTSLKAFLLIPTKEKKKRSTRLGFSILDGRWRLIFLLLEKKRKREKMKRYFFFLCYYWTRQAGWWCWWWIMKHVFVIPVTPLKRMEKISKRGKRKRERERPPRHWCVQLPFQEVERRARARAYFGVHFGTKKKKDLFLNFWFLFIYLFLPTVLGCGRKESGSSGEKCGWCFVRTKRGRKVTDW